MSRIIDWFPYELDSHYHVVVHGCSTCFVSVHYFWLSCVPKSCQHSIQFLCLTMKLIDSITYFSKYLASLIFSLRIGFSLPYGCPWKQYLFRHRPLFRLSCVPKSCYILHNFCVSQWSSSIVFHNFQSISHHWFISRQIGFSLTCGCPWKQYLFRQYLLFDYHVSLNLANILHKFCVSQWSSSILLHIFQGISHHWLISLQNGVTLSWGCPWMQ